MSSGLLSIGASALDAAYTALRTTGNNIANVNTPGYSRETTNFTAQVENGTGTLYMGTGVATSAIARVYNSFLAQQTNLAQAMSSQADATAQLTGQVNGLFANSSTSLGAAIDSFFNQVQGLSAQPGSAASRQTTLSAAQQMVSQFNAMAAQLNQMQQSTDQQLGQQMTTVNSTVSQIASLNSQISLAVASGGTPNALLDQRDNAVQTLNQAIGVTATTQSDGSVNIFLANGQPLLVGTKAYALTMATDPQNSQNIIVGTSTGGTGLIALDPANAGGGTIGGMLQFRNLTLPSLQEQVGRLAVTLASQFNALQAQGQDLNGNTGANLSKFFSTPAVATSSASTNGGNGALSATIADVTQLQASDYTLTYAGGSNYTLTRLSDGKQTTNVQMGQTVDGMTLSMDTSRGAPAVGDSFNIQPTRFGAQNLSLAITQGSQIAAASPMQASVAPGNTGSLAIGNLALQPLPANPDPNLQQAVTFKFSSPTQFTYSIGGGAASAPQSYTAGQPINLNGWSLTLSGSAASGDTVNIAAGGSGSADNRNALLMTQLQGQAIVGRTLASGAPTGGATLDSAYAAVVGNVGALAANATTDQTSKNAILQSATTAQSAVSGVNLDEEAAKLMQYQQQYQAAAKMIQTAGNVFDAILAVAGAA
jgi:flagellar hook-associated protein 1 FlgK